MRLLVATFILMPLLAFCQSMTTPGVGQLPQKFDTIAQLVSRPGTNYQTVLVRGYSSVGDWGAERQARFIPGTGASTNRGCDFATTGGRWHFPDCDSGEVDAKWFGAQPFQSDLMTPWSYQTNIAAIGTNDFSVWTRMLMPSSINQPMGLWSLSVSDTNSDYAARINHSAFSFRATPTAFGYIARSTNGSSSSGTTVDDGALFNTATPSSFSSYFGNTVDMVFTRKGTNIHCYINGTNVDSLLTASNLDGWSKSVGLGGTLTLQIGLNDSGWYWPGAVSRFAMWASELSAVQAANPSAVGSKTVDYTPASTNTTDSSAVINAAIDYAASLGGSTVRIPSGKYRLDSGIVLKPKVRLRGDMAASYPVNFNLGYSYGSSVLIPWFGTEMSVISISRDNCDPSDVLITPRVISGVNSYTYSLASYVQIDNLVVDGWFALAARGIYSDRVGCVVIQDCGISRMPGYPIYATVGNVFFVRNCSGSLNRSLMLRGLADTKLHHNFFDGSSGPALWGYMNWNNVGGNTFEVSGDQTAGASPVRQVITADPSADTITITANVPHRFLTGDVVRFDTDGTIPGGLATNVDYYVGNTTLTNFQVFAKYSDDLTGEGALNNMSPVDITDTGTGTHRVNVGPAVGMLITGDQNQIYGNVSHFNYEEALRLEYANRNSISDNIFTLNGLGNADTNAACAIRLIESAQNRIVANAIDDRDTAGYTQYGIIGDNLSTANSIIGNSWNVTFPYRVAADNYIADSDAVRHTYSGAALHIPSASSFFGRTTTATNGSSEIVYDPSNKRILLSEGSTEASNTNWQYSITFNADGPAYWNSLNGSSLQSVNNTTTASPFAYFYGPYSSAVFFTQVSSTNAAEGVRWALTRNRGETNGLLSPLISGDQIGEIFFLGYKDTNNVSAIGATIEGIAGSNWTTNSTEGRINLRVTPAGSTARATQIQIMDKGRIAFTGQASDPATSVANGQLYYNNTSGLNQRHGSAWIPLNSVYANSSTINVPNFIDSIYIQFATSGNNIYALPLNSGVTAGTYSNPSLTVDVKGRITNISSGSAGDEVTVNGSATSNPNFKDGSNITFGLSGSDVTADLTATGVGAGSYTAAGGSITVDAKGRVTAASSGLSGYTIVNSFIGAGPNISIDNSSGTNIVISATTGGSTNGTPLYVDAAGPLATANLADSTEVNPAASGTNVTFSIVTSSIATNKIDSTFYNLLMAADVDTATNILVNGTLVTFANLQDDTGAGGVNFVVSGSNIKAYATNVTHGLTFTNGLTNSANVVQWAVAPGANITLTTNNGQITIAASTGVTNSGTGVSVDSGALLVYANLINSSEVDPSVSGTNVSFAIVNNSLETNRLTTNAFIYLLNRANHLNTQPWTTIDSTPTTLGGYGIVNAQLTNTTLTRLGGIGPGTAGDIIYRDATGWTNLAKGTDGDVLTLASGYPNWEPPTVGSSGGYLAKSVTVTMASNTVDEVDLVTWTIPADTLSTDGDELEFHVPAKYRQYTGLTTAYTYEFAIDDDTGGEAYIDGSFAPGTASISSAYQMDWTVRVKRMSSTTAFITLKHVLGADNAGDTTNIVTASRYLEHTLNVGWNDDVVFQLRVSLGTAAADHCIVAYGSTVRKLR